MNVDCTETLIDGDRVSVTECAELRALALITQDDRAGTAAIDIACEDDLAMKIQITVRVDNFSEMLDKSTCEGARKCAGCDSFDESVVTRLPGAGRRERCDLSRSGRSLRLPCAGESCNRSHRHRKHY